MPRRSIRAKENITTYVLFVMYLVSVSATFCGYLGVITWKEQCEGKVGLFRFPNRKSINKVVFSNTNSIC